MVMMQSHAHNMYITILTIIYAVWMGGVGGLGMGCQWLAGLVSRVCLRKGENNDWQQR